MHMQCGRAAAMGMTAGGLDALRTVARLDASRTRERAARRAGRLEARYALR